MRKCLFKLEALLLLLFVLISCSKENDSIKDVENSKFEKNEVDLFLKSHFNNDYLYSESIVVYENNYKYIVTEVILDSNDAVRGYTVIDELMHDFLYFAEVNLSLGQITTYDNKSKESYILYDFLINDEKLDLNNFNLINDIKKNHGSNTTTSKFWGWSCGSSFELETDSCYRTCCYRVLGVVTSCNVYTCNNLPGTNPSLEP